MCRYLGVITNVLPLIHVVFAVSKSTDVTSSSFQQDASLSGYACASTMVSFGNHRGVIMCASACVRLGTCSSFFYNMSDKTCAGKVGDVMTSTSGCSVDSNIVYYINTGLPLTPPSPQTTSPDTSLLANTALRTSTPAAGTTLTSSSTSISSSTPNTSSTITPTTSSTTASTITPTTRSTTSSTTASTITPTTRSTTSSTTASTITPTTRSTTSSTTRPTTTSTSISTTSSTNTPTTPSTITPTTLPTSTRPSATITSTTSTLTTTPTSPKATTTPITGCVTFSDCKVTHMECVDSVCQCGRSYRLDVQTDTCVTECSTYGSTFTCFAGTVFKVDPMAVYSGNTMEECQKHCASLTSCRGFNLDANKCSVIATTASATTVSDTGYFSTDASTIYCNRNCATSSVFLSNNLNKAVLTA